MISISKGSLPCFHGIVYIQMSFKAALINIFIIIYQMTVKAVSCTNKHILSYNSRFHQPPFPWQAAVFSKKTQKTAVIIGCQSISGSLYSLYYLKSSWWRFSGLCVCS